MIEDIQTEKLFMLLLFGFLTFVVFLMALASHENRLQERAALELGYVQQYSSEAHALLWVKKEPK